ncbi:MAG TPA: PAS domain S-box protein, partial [Micavibrio sp.]|nr:PAS domain S-box protein [Micavibrio sp.]
MTGPKIVTGYSPDSSEIAQAYLAAIVKSSSDAIISKNLDGTITSWNAGAENIFGYTASEAIGRNISLIIPEDRLWEEAHIIKKIRSGQGIEHFETIRRAKDGRMIELSITISPIRDNSGVVIGASKVARDITEKKRIERLLKKTNEELEMRVHDRTQALQQQRAFLKAILDSICDSVVACDENGILNLFNRSSEDLHLEETKAIPPEEWASFYHLYYADGKTLMKTEDIPLMRALRDGRVENVEMVVAVPGQEPRTLLASGQSLMDKQGRKFGAVVSMHDVTEQKKQQAALIESRSFLRKMIDTVPDPIFVKDDKHCWIEGNVAFWNLVGPEENIRGKSDYDLFPKEQADQFWEGDNQVFTGGKLHDAEERLRTRDGKDIVIVTRKMPLTLPDGRKALVGIIRDVTQQRQIEEELQQHRNNLQELVHVQTKNLIKAKERAEASSRSKEEFLANMSHEIRTPMNAVLGIAQILNSGQHTPEKQRELLNTLTVSAHQILDLMNDLLDVSKIEDASFSLENVPICLEEIVAEVISINRIAAQNKNIALEYDYRIKGPRNFMSDPVRLRQVLMNLTSNAVKFTSEGYVRIEVDSLEQSSHKSDELHVRIDVIDSGPGIDADKIGRIFERFVQADNSVARKYGGSGLGLTICKQLVEMMGGTISVKSAPGSGSCFTVIVPLKIAGDGGMVEGGAGGDGKVRAADSAKKTILLVEDYEPNILV